MNIYPLFHHGIGRMTRQGATIDCKCTVRDRAVPYLVIAFALAAILAAGGFEGFHDLPVEALTH